ncbi:hypothetical protein HPO_04910 [Hyphomonas polymorpha PS728]|uniref:Uncharacterized protein n=1 Tax=Hyphomonas polymorpha PS728 TaxID=1280954 RepID=A0A062VJB3_9PROT|nr:hypothetical protein [Hyphomonas polymorpha]KCZ99699.1 hypothetical protein HPO_04910 [Hyphomonas polymorpha PS728]
MSDKENDALDRNTRDVLAAVAKGAVGAVPFVGGILGEIISEVIPGQRQDRLVKYLRLLEQRLSQLEQDKIDRAIGDPERIDLFERGAHQAVRATTDERIAQIVEIVFNGMSRDDADIVRRKRLAGLLDQLDNDEIGILNAYGQSYGSGKSDPWTEIPRPAPVNMKSTTSEIDDDALFNLGKENLLRLGLLRRNFGTVKKGEYPPFDANSGGFKSRMEISYLGRLLLREIGLPSPIDT